VRIKDIEEASKDKIEVCSSGREHKKVRKSAKQIEVSLSTVKKTTENMVKIY
jgi:hypothetical protein